MDGTRRLTNGRVIMTRKDYELIARIIDTSRTYHSSTEASDAIDAVANMLAGAFRVGNPRFDADRFAAAAGCYVPSVGDAA
jgi:hypothetical protein